MINSPQADRGSDIRKNIFLMVYMLSFREVAYGKQDQAMKVPQIGSCAAHGHTTQALLGVMGVKGATCQVGYEKRLTHCGLRRSMQLRKMALRDNLSKWNKGMFLPNLA